jgi:hypothetical protein
VSHLTAGLYSDEPAIPISVNIPWQRIPGLDIGKLVVIEPGAAQSFVVHLKPERLDDMKRRSGVGAQANNIPRIRRDFRLAKNNMKRRLAHQTISSSVTSAKDTFKLDE